MVNWRISNDLKEIALTFRNNGWPLEDICELLGVLRASCYWWREILEEHGDVSRPPAPLVGPTCKITHAILGAIEQPYSEDSDLFLDEVCTWLAVEHNIEISTSGMS
ncbi:hypothetical protein L210DRAFT_848292 [Boletus edulis BED1]|uniref:Uncharacterized protein n=1 Tax=Boletus edulis BED1 TaxID=1328754 RepID=A0AAD4BZV6_BOLED|nr:hypothetical protein L210DRAFT_848292 [Boletus edulis BED1]